MDNLALDTYHPLHDQRITADSIEIDALPWGEIMVLRGWWTNPAEKDWFKAQFGSKPPKAMAVKETDLGRIVWQGPDCLWVFLSEGVYATEQIARLRETVSEDLHVSIIEAGNYYLRFQLSGSRVVDILRQGCPYDFRQLEESQAVFSVYYKASVMIDCVAEDRYVVAVRQSYAPYLWQHFSKAVKAVSVVT